MLTEVTVRLLPRHDSQALVVLPLASIAEAKASVARVLGSYLQPLALEVVSADAFPADFAASTAKLPRAHSGAAPATSGALIAAGRPLLLAGFSGHRAAVDRSVREVIETNPGATAQVLRDDAAEALYEHLAAEGTGKNAERLSLRASVPISRALDVVAAAQEYGAANGFSRRLPGRRRPGTGGPALRDGRRPRSCRPRPAERGARSGRLPHPLARAGRLHGWLALRHRRNGLLPSGYDAWGDVGSAVALMKRIKERFDPRGILNPGRFVGGI